MHKYTLLSFLLAQLMPLWLISQVSLMTFNIRYNNPEDAANWWEYRKVALAEMVSYHAPDVLGIQEGLQGQVHYLDSALVHYDYVGVGRDDGDTQGEYTAIFYNNQRFSPLLSRTYWLSETPDKISVGWDASMERIVTFVALLNLKTKDTLYVYNAHFDHRGSLARAKAATLICRLIEEQGILKQPVVVMGDFNCEPNSKPMAIFDQYFDDAYTISTHKPYGPVGTWQSFSPEVIPVKRIDYILTRNIQVLKYAHLTDKRPDNLPLSDHLPVFISIK